jgi:hypothetical protein
MYKAKVAVYSDFRTNHSAQSDNHVEFFFVKPARLWKDRPRNEFLVLWV